ncbi:hypothetical protein Tco_0851192 [Tanacetum coccineum]
MAQNDMKREQSWIFDCGATDTMTHDLADFATTTKPTKSYIHTANGEKMNVKNGGTIEISPTLKLSKCLYVPDLISGRERSLGVALKDKGYIKWMRWLKTIMLCFLMGRWNEKPGYGIGD